MIEAETRERVIGRGGQGKSRKGRSNIQGSNKQCSLHKQNEYYMERYL